MTEKNPNEIVFGLKQQNFNSTEMCYNNKIFTQRKCVFFFTEFRLFNLFRDIIRLLTELIFLLQNFMIFVIHHFLH